MRNSSFFLSVFSVLALASCSQKSTVSLSLAGVGDGNEIVLKRLEVDEWKTIDTLKLRSGRVAARVEVLPTSPQFLYFFRNGSNIAAVILKDGDNVTVKADTLGNYSVTGSEDSEQFRLFNLEHSAFLKAFLSANSTKEAGEVYVAHYQKNVRFLTNNPHSIVNVPIMFENIGPDNPVFSQLTDAVRFRTVTDSLKAIYPDSPFVKALENETQKRERAFELQLKVNNSSDISYPNLNIASIDGTKASLAAMEADLVLLYFWNADDARQKMFNLEYLKPLYSAYNSKGFDIYSVAITRDKVSWAAVVESQKLPWTNVCDGFGNASRSLTTYNVTELPCCMLLGKGILEKVSGVENLKGAVAEKLKGR